MWLYRWAGRLFGFESQPLALTHANMCRLLNTRSLKGRADGCRPSSRCSTSQRGTLDSGVVAVCISNNKQLGHTERAGRLANLRRPSLSTQPPTLLLSFAKPKTPTHTLEAKTTDTPKHRNAKKRTPHSPPRFVQPNFEPRWAYTPQNNKSAATLSLHRRAVLTVPYSNPLERRRSLPPGRGNAPSHDRRRRSR